MQQPESPRFANTAEQSVWHDGTSWRQNRGGAHHTIEPARQARDACYALREFIESDPRWTQKRVRWDHMVVLPNTELPSDFAVPDCPRWKVIDRTQLAELLPLMRIVLLKQELDRPHIGSEGIAQLQLCMRGRGLPQLDVVARASENEMTADLLSQEQAVILRAIDVLDRVEIRGGAGSGKTYLAVEQARRLTKSGKRVALICYSHGLASYLERLTGKWGHKEKPAYVGEFHDLGKRWGAAAGPDESIRNTETAQFWEHDLPLQMTQLAEELPPGKRFDAIIIDEAQDFADEWWKPMLACLTDPDTSRIYVFSDEAQRVFDREGSPPVDLVPLILDHNLRNTRQIARAFGPLVGQRMQLRGGDGPDVRFVACSADDALGVADDQVQGMFDAGWGYEDIALLSTGSRHPMQVERQAEGNDSYWKAFWDNDDIFYGHVLGFKGLERRVIILALNEFTPRDRSKERLYVGLSRARDQLVICGDPEFVREVGGPELASRLGL
ncbi:ATP-binding domain-containing protein [Williamsia maris]